jgi:plastocyanin
MCLVAYGGLATDISGTIVLRKNLDRKKVNATIYNLRGIAVETAPSLHKQGTFNHTAVWLEAGTIGNPVPPTTIRMEQLGRRFQPEIAIIPIGSTVEFPNLDPIFHNIFSLSRSQSFDLGYYAEGKSRNVTFTRPGIVQVYCHIHADMYGVIVVAPDAWFGLPDSNGIFSFSKVPPGEYRLAIWQRSAGLFRKKLHVFSSGTIHVDVTLPEEKDE